MALPLTADLEKKWDIGILRNSCSNKIEDHSIVLVIFEKGKIQDLRNIEHFFQVPVNRNRGILTSVMTFSVNCIVSLLKYILS